MALYYFPPFKSNDDLNDHLNRASWYFDCLIGEKIYFYTSASYTYKLIPYFSKNLAHLYESNISNGRFIIDDVNLLEQRQPEQNDYIIQWKDQSELSTFEITQLHVLQSTGAKTFDINKSRRMEGSLYIEISRDFYQADTNFADSNKLKFEKLYALHKGKEDAFLFCTGPSIREHTNYRYDSGVTIICNSVINDEELMQLIQPDIFVFADPIFHFGCSSYAEAFRTRLKDVAARYNFNIIIPIKYYPLFCHCLPELTERTIAIPYEDHDNFELNLNSNFSLKTTDNILTFLMLPIATTLSNNIYIMGCDGRPLDEDDYFWGHNAKTQFINEMDSIQKAHPSFFKLEYNEYYLRHCENILTIFKQGEENGKTFISLGFSYIAALNDREFKYRHLSQNSSSDLFVSINPDMKDGFGHYYPYDERLYEALEDGEELLILGNKDASLTHSKCLIENTFLNVTGTLRWTNDPNALDDWIKELSAPLKDLLILRRNKHVYMYMGTIRFYTAILKIVAQFCDLKAINFKINLFYAHMDYEKKHFISSAEFQEYKNLFEYYTLSYQIPIQLYSDSERLTKRLNQDFNLKLDLWPMICVTNPALIEAEKSSDLDQLQNENFLYVLFPGNGQMTKGFDLACDLIASYSAPPMHNGKKIIFLIRDQLRDNEDNNNILLEKLNSVEKCSWANIIKGHLSEQEYLALFHQADIIILPYRSSAFYSRTSGCLVDALAFQCPIIAHSNTWLGDWIVKLNAGRTTEEGNLDEMKLVLTELLENNQLSITDIKNIFNPKHLREVLNSNSDKPIPPYSHEILASSLQRLLISQKRKKTIFSFFTTLKSVESIAQSLKAHPFFYKLAQLCWKIFKFIFRR